MEKYIVVQSVKTLNLTKGQLLIIDEKGVPYLAGDYNTKFPFIDIRNTDYFQSFKEKFKVGTYVSYNDIVYVISNFNVKSKTYELSFVDSPKIAYSAIYESHLKETSIYYFVSSRGGVQRAVLGKDKTADRWREYTNNCFETKDAADKWIDSVLITKRNEEIKNNKK